MKNGFFKKTVLYTCLILFAHTGFSQSWSYVGGSCCIGGNSSITQSLGSAELLFKSDGTPVVVGFGSNPSVIVAKEFNGTSWISYASFSVAATFLGGIDAEIHNDEVYVAAIDNGLVVKKYNGTAWVDIGTKINLSFSSTNYDFAIDGAGTPYVARFDRKLYKFDGTSWSNIYTFPQTSGSTILTYGFTGDNTLLFDTNNYPSYLVQASGKQFLSKYDGSSETIVGDTLFNTQHNAQLFKNSANEFFAAFSTIAQTPFIKKFNGTTWTLYGDTTGLGNVGAGFSLLTFGTGGELYYTISGTTHKKVYSCSGLASPFIALDTLSHNGFAQFTDITVNPVDGKVYAAFNNIGSFADFSVMKYDGATTGILSNVKKTSAIGIYPNPATDMVTIDFTDSEFGLEETVVCLYDMQGKKVLERSIRSVVSQLNVEGLPKGVYLLKAGNKEKYRVNKLVIE